MRQAPAMIMLLRASALGREAGECAAPGIGVNGALLGAWDM